MDFLNRWTIKSRLGFGYALLGLAVLVVTIVALKALSKSQANFEKQVDQLDVIQALGNEVLDAANARAVFARNLVIAASDERVQYNKSLIEKPIEMCKRTVKSCKQRCRNWTRPTPHFSRPWTVL
jgi:methyl-accepting chemotaxis protein-1 (serine sensor receptor)